MSEEITIPNEIITSKIYLIRDQKVMLDRDLAELYGVETKRLKEAVRRNTERFPEDFMFEMTKNEFQNWRTQFATSKTDQKGLRYAPFCFTEQGVTMLSCVLNSKKAIEVNIRIIRVFTKIRQTLTDNLSVKLEIEEIKKKLTNHSKNIELVFDYLDELNKKLDTPELDERKKIGYKK
ncbi:ORF6N domain-containing protein [Aquimarina sp. MAR_2010_214]|uniref:ORF6N domain-containing protein n=1 Tax=Aquimarina sp. MAR_2010_214 TaxID=1250026 RepID=UPI000C714CC3|nr:ORF6N domain-containing protein [Aquimarina sp. MAR_2010_214]PKV52459.1 ORF6N domain-containing protein [Aquimarina sp. MAR_2010_214]